MHLVGLRADQDGRGGGLGLHDGLVGVAELEGRRIFPLIGIFLGSADFCTSMFSMWKSTLEGKNSSSECSQMRGAHSRIIRLVASSTSADTPPGVVGADRAANRKAEAKVFIVKGLLLFPTLIMFALQDYEFI